MAASILSISQTIRRVSEPPLSYSAGTARSSNNPEYIPVTNVIAIAPGFTNHISNSRMAVLIVADDRLIAWAILKDIRSQFGQLGAFPFLQFNMRGDCVAAE